MKRQFWHNGESASYLKNHTCLFIKTHQLSGLLFCFVFFLREKMFLCYQS